MCLQADRAPKRRKKKERRGVKRETVSGGNDGVERMVGKVEGNGVITEKEMIYVKKRKKKLKKLTRESVYSKNSRLANAIRFLY